MDLLLLVVGVMKEKGKVENWEKVQMAPNGSKWLKIYITCSNSLQIPPNSFKILQITTNCYRLIHIAQHASKWCKIAPNGSKWLEMVAEASQCNGSQWP